MPHFLICLFFQSIAALLLSVDIRMEGDSRVEQSWADITEPLCSERLSRPLGLVEVISKVGTGDGCRIEVRRCH